MYRNLNSLRMLKVFIINLDSSKKVNKLKHADLVKLSPFLFKKVANYTKPVFEAIASLVHTKYE